MNFIFNSEQKKKIERETKNKQKRTGKSGAKSNFSFNYEAQSWRGETAKNCSRALSWLIIHGCDK